MKPAQKEAVAERSAIRYDENPDTRFFLCTTCHTHIALLREPFSLVTPLNFLLFDHIYVCVHTFQNLLFHNAIQLTHRMNLENKIQLLILRQAPCRLIEMNFEH